MPESPKRPGPPVPDPNWELELHGSAAGSRRSGPDSKDPLLAHALLRSEPEPIEIDFDLELGPAGRVSPPFATGPAALDDLSDMDRATAPPPEAMSTHVARMMAQAQLMAELDDEGDRPTPIIESERLPLLPGNGLFARAPEPHPAPAWDARPSPQQDVRPAPRGISVRFEAERKETPLVEVGLAAKQIAGDLSDLPAVFSLDGIEEPGSQAALSAPMSEAAISPAAISPSLAAAPISEPAISPPFASLDPLDLGWDLASPSAPSAETMSAIEARIAAGDYGRALVLAESALDAHPGDPEITRHAESCREMLYSRYLERLGAGDHVPRLAMQRSALTGLALDHRTGFLLSCVDGVSTLEEIIDVSAMPRLDAVRMIYELVQEGVIEMVAPR